MGDRRQGWLAAGWRGRGATGTMAAGVGPPGRPPAGSARIAVTAATTAPSTPITACAAGNGPAPAATAGRRCRRAAACCPTCARQPVTTCGPTAAQRSLPTTVRSPNNGLTCSRFQRIPAPFSRTSTPSLCARSTIPLPPDHPAATKAGYVI